MRKNIKVKKRCCAMCKPHKRGWSSRWKPKERSRMKEDGRHIARLK